MAFTLADLNVLDAAIASGVLHVSYSDRNVTYQSTTEMLKARALMVNAIAATAGTTVSRTSYGKFLRE